MIIYHNAWRLHLVPCENWHIMQERLSSYDESFLLGSQAQQEIAYSILEVSNTITHHAIGVGIVYEFQDTQAHIMLLRDDEFWVGVNRQICAFHFDPARQAFRMAFDGMFFEFIHVPQLHLILALHEIGAIALHENGDQAWKADTDIITHWSVDDNLLNLNFLDDPPLRTNLQDGFHMD